jgi:tetrahydromethanopterin S-methyltransferase subunit H
VRSQALVRKGLVRVGQGFSVRASKLQAGSQDVAELQGIWQVLADNAVTAMGAMAGAAGHAGLTSALSEAAGKGNKSFTGLWAAYGHVSSSLTSCAVTYTKADQAAAAAAGALQRSDPLLQWLR